MRPPDYDLFETLNFALSNGGVLPVARLAYVTHGQLAPEKDNAILFPTWFGSDHLSNAWLIGPDKALDPRRYFIVCVNLLGNGLSSSPSNTPAPLDGPRFPRISVLDNVRLQRQMLREQYDIQRLQLVVGRSMGAQAAFQWGASFPLEAGRVFALCGSARTTPHNQVFLDSIKAALQADCCWNSGDYRMQPEKGLRAMGRAYAAWAMSPHFYRQGLYLGEGVTSVEDYVQKRWAPNFLKRDANDLLSMIGTWQTADIGSDPKFRGDWQSALAAISAPALVMPSRTDMYFPPEDSAEAVAGIPDAELRVIESIWGHRAGSPGSDPRDIAAVDEAIRHLLGR